ncbi:Thymidylate kinase [Gnomoniopsis smithogilvyi]|uniref:Thymidylate kinase n=1 Tax=Gnomoniopsis smithogilvyi TaxID=1191159 RepID=A0A9W8YN39_9PEZI|nr:Thymidylate kinase [Gnomoniopsis smithogilvyi]
MSTTGESPVTRGAFIVLEGLDRSGKSTQVGLLEKKLKAEGREVRVMRFPDRTTSTGQIINNYLTTTTPLPDQAIHLLFTANRWEAAPTIHALLSAGVTIVCDRYYYSGMVYSAAKRNPALSLSWARAPEVGLPRPDVVVFLDLSEAEAAARGGWGEERYERGEMQRRVREGFEGLKGAGGEEGEDLRVVDAGGSVEVVEGRVWEAVKGRIEEVEKGLVGGQVRIVS